MKNNQSADFVPNSPSEKGRPDSVTSIDEWVRLAIETSDTYWWQLDLQTNLARYSPNAERILGRPPARILEDNLVFLHPDDQLIPAQAVEEAIRTGSDRFEYQVRSVALADQVRWFEISGKILRDGQAQPTMIVGRAQNITLNKQAEADRHRSELKYHTLFESIDEGFCLIEVLYDATGAAIDYRFLDVNPAFERITAAESVVGKTAHELNPDVEPHWVETYDRVARTGEPSRFENFHAFTGQWYQVYASRMGEAGSHQVTVVFNDITSRKQAEQVLRQSEEQHAFLLRLSDTLRPLHDPIDIQVTATRIAFDYFGADRVYYCEIDGSQVSVRQSTSRPDLPVIPATYSLDQLPVMKALLQRGHPVVVPDVAITNVIDEALKQLSLKLNIRAYIQVPVVKNGQLVGKFCVTKDQPRDWSNLDIKLAAETAERTWAAVERVKAEKALQQSEAKFRTLFESIDEGFCVIELMYDAQGRPVDWLYLVANPTFERQMGLDPVGKRITQIVPQVERFWFDFYQQVIQTQLPARTENHLAALDRWYSIFASPVEETTNRLAVIFDDVTQRKRQSINLAMLAEINDRIARLTSPEEIMQAVGEELFSKYGLSRLTFAYIDEKEGTATIVYDRHQSATATVLGKHRLNDFIDPAYRSQVISGQLVIIDDITTDSHKTASQPTHSIFSSGALLLVPQMSNGQCRFISALNKFQPGAWRTDQVELLQEVAPRLFLALERLRLEEIRQLTLLQQTEELAKIGSWEYNRQANQFIWSAGMYNLFEFKPVLPITPVEPEIFLKVAQDEDRASAQRLVNYLRGGEGHLETDLQIRVDNQDKTLRIKADAIGEGDQTRLVGVVLDLTEQLMIQRQVQETARNLQVVLDGSPAAIGLLKAIRDPTCAERIVDFELAVGNRKLAQFLKKPLEKLLGTSVDQFNRLLWGGHTLDILLQVRLTGEPRYEEHQLTTDGRWLAIATTSQDDGVLITALDISGLKTIQDQQQHWVAEVETSRRSLEALSDLRRALAHRSELLRAVSHDLRSNFGIIQGSLQLLSMATSEAERAQMIEMVLRNVQQATGMLTELLDFSRLEAGQQKRSLDSFDVTSLLEELCQSLQGSAQEQGLFLISAGPQTLVVESDRLLVYRMAQNLTVNALKYTHRGNITVNWNIDSDQTRWWFSVSDMGPGIDANLVAWLNQESESTTAPSANQLRIGSWDKPSSGASTPDTAFAATHQPGLDWTRLRGEGIGLRIVRQLAQLLNARLEVSSEAGLGTRFMISFPMRYI